MIGTSHRGPDSRHRVTQRSQGARTSREAGEDIFKRPPAHALLPKQGVGC
ncbi:unnamed protein product [Staurois parvus]|uniref:Uncharacterized protein n=1 Tax=Staurois parvus TaxID=386267 RepID=A0ABN9AYB4_9NEOB|nr:unnamed protein product [Staurois parvus]